jgi:cytochrome P450
MIKAGDKVVCPVALGSRDARDYTDPVEVDFDRGARRHLAFGFGQHICIGMHLARLELVTALRCWLANVPPFSLPPGYQAPWHGGVSLGLDALELRW